MPEYPRSPLRKVGDIVRSRVPTDTFEMIDDMSYGVSWDENTPTSACVRTGALEGVAASSSAGDALLPIQAGIRGCLLNDDGVVQYYTGATDRTVKSGGGASVLTGADGQVMQQIPAFYQKYGYSGTVHTWDISLLPLDGFSLHPAFVKNGVAVPYRYMSAYEGSMWDASAGAMVGSADIVNAYTIGTGDLLCSVSGEYPKVNETQAEFRGLAARRGTGWRQMDYDLVSAIQLLYLTEYADFNSQSMIGMGRTQLSGGTWTADSYIGQCGKSNGDGNSTNSVGGNTNDAYMTYRGIENLYGNVWKFFDGFNINNNIPYVCNDDSDFQDDTTDNYTALGLTLINANGYQKTLEQTDRGFLPASVGGASSTYITDYYYQNTGWRVGRLGGNASGALAAGVFYLDMYSASSYGLVSISGRLAF